LIDLNLNEILTNPLLFSLLGLEIVLRHEIFKADNDAYSGNVVPVVSRVIAGNGTLTTIVNLKANYDL